MATGNHTNQSAKMSQIFKMSQTLCSNGGGGGYVGIRLKVN